MAGERKAEFDSLPPNAKNAIKKILEHRKLFRSMAIGTSVAVTLMESAAASLALLSTQIKSSAAKGVILTVAGVSALAGLTIGGGILVTLRVHGIQFRKEYMELYKSLNTKKVSPATKTFLEKYPYLTVDKKGNLIGKKHAPSILRIPIGRRRVASSRAGRKKIRKWRKKTLPKPRTRKRHS